MFLNLHGKYQHTEPIDDKIRSVAKEVFTMADKDGDHKLHTPELYHFAEKVDPLVESQDVQIIKTFLDINGDMNLSCEEFVPFVELILKNKVAREESLSSITPEVQALFDQHELSGDRQLDFDELHSLVVTVDDTITEDVLQELMDSFDTNYNDKLSLKEFSHLYQLIIERKNKRENKA
ncbi:MAG: hypothetical protein BYD32DRAFT_483561 [Podila humilis]|nr:MAG: hypothetical protein BYD32DRAFT_483561 [Podila humilis]